MNLILLQPEEISADNRVVLKGRRFEHITLVHKAKVGETLCVGRVDGMIGDGKVLAIDSESIELYVDLHIESPPPLPITVLLALPRPKMLKRILINLISMGVKRIILINSYRVEKSFWLSPVIQPAGLAELITLGLEQGKDTLWPQIELKKRFKPFVEDELADIADGTRCLVAHPYRAEPAPANCTEPLTLAIGPEGGFIPYEIEKLVEVGFSSVHLGQRILRVEAAVPALIGRLMDLSG